MSTYQTKSGKAPIDYRPSKERVTVECPYCRQAHTNTRMGTDHWLRSHRCPKAPRQKGSRR